MWVEDVNKAGGLEVGGKKYKVELAVEDNEAKAESAAKATTKLITVDEVIANRGPQASKQAVPAGEVANNYKTPLISGWSTNPKPTKDRPYVFRACFLDDFPGAGPVDLRLGGIQVQEGGRALRCGQRLPKGLAEFFQKDWEKKNGPARSWPMKASPPRTPTSVPS